MSEITEEPLGNASTHEEKIGSEEKKNTATRRRRSLQSKSQKRGLTKDSRDVIPSAESQKESTNPVSSADDSVKSESSAKSEKQKVKSASASRHSSRAKTQKKTQEDAQENMQGNSQDNAQGNKQTNTQSQTKPKNGGKTPVNRQRKNSDADPKNNNDRKTAEKQNSAHETDNMDNKTWTIPAFSAAPQTQTPKKVALTEETTQQPARTNTFLKAPIFQPPTFNMAQYYEKDSESEPALHQERNSRGKKNTRARSNTDNEQDSPQTPTKNRRIRSRRKDNKDNSAKENIKDNNSDTSNAEEKAETVGKEKRSSKNLGDQQNGQKLASKNSSKDKDASKDASSSADSTAQENEKGSTRRRRRTRNHSAAQENEVAILKGSTRLEAKRQRRKEERREGRRRTLITEAEFLARRESVDRQMVVREKDGLNQIAILEDGLLVEHYVSRHTQTTMVGNIYLGKVQNVLPSMEAAFVDLGKGRNAVLYAGEVNWDATGKSGKTGRIEDALSSGNNVLVQVTKDPIGHKGARLTSQITLPGRHLVLVPSGGMTGISRKLPQEERTRLKEILKEIIPSGYGVIVRTAAEGATEEQLREDVEHLTKIWQDLQDKKERAKNAPLLLHAEPELALRVIRDIFNEDFKTLTVQGDQSWKSISQYVKQLSPELFERLVHWQGEDDVFAAHRVDEQLSKGFERKVWLPSGGYLIIDRTEAMSVIDVNTGRYIGSGGTLEETITKNNLEAAEEIVRQLRLRDIGGIVVIDFVDMVIESNRDLVLRRLIECLGRDRTRHQVTEITSLGLVQMTRKRVGQGLVEAFSTTCECCNGRGFIVHDTPVERNGQAIEDVPSAQKKSTSGRNPRQGGRDKKSGYAQKKNSAAPEPQQDDSSKHLLPKVEETKPEVRQAIFGIAKAAAQAHDNTQSSGVKKDFNKDFGEGSASEGSAVYNRSAGVNEQVEQADEPEQKSVRTRRRRASSSGIITA